MSLFSDLYNVALAVPDLHGKGRCCICAIGEWNGSPDEWAALDMRVFLHMKLCWRNCRRCKNRQQRTTCAQGAASGCVSFKSCGSEGRPKGIGMWTSFYNNLALFLKKCENTTCQLRSKERLVVCGKMKLINILTTCCHRWQTETDRCVVPEL